VNFILFYVTVTVSYLFGLLCVVRCAERLHPYQCTRVYTSKSSPLSSMATDDRMRAADGDSNIQSSTCKIYGPSVPALSGIPVDSDPDS